MSNVRPVSSYVQSLYDIKRYFGPKSWGELSQLCIHLKLGFSYRAGIFLLVFHHLVSLLSLCLNTGEVYNRQWEWPSCTGGGAKLLALPPHAGW